MCVVGRGAVLGLLLGIPRISAPRSLPRTKRVIDIAALVVAIDLAGEGGGEKDNRPGRSGSRRQHIERHDVLNILATQADAVPPRSRSLGDVDREVGFPATIVEVILVEVNRGVVARRMTPIGLM